MNQKLLLGSCLFALLCFFEGASFAMEGQFSDEVAPEGLQRELSSIVREDPGPSGETVSPHDEEGVVLNIPLKLKPGQLGQLAAIISKEKMRSAMLTAKNAVTEVAHTFSELAGGGAATSEVIAPVEQEDPLVNILEQLQAMGYEVEFKEVPAVTREIKSNAPPEAAQEI